MSQSLFDNNMGFRPEGTVLKFWVLLPQISNSINSEPVPSIYGKPKSLVLPIIMVLLLIVLELLLVFQLNDEGVGVMALIGLSAFDFVIAVLPVFILYNFNLYPALEKANLFLIKAKIHVGERNSLNTSQQEAYLEDLREKQKSIKRKLRGILLIELFFAIVIVAFGFWKFVTYHAVFGDDIYVEAIGRFIIVVVLLSIITHIFFTGTVATYIGFMLSLWKQLTGFRNQQFKVSKSDTNKKVPLIFNVEYSPEHSGNQLVAQFYNNHQPTASGNNVQLIELEHNGVKEKFRIDRFEGNENVFLIYTGLLTDSEINGLYVSQGDSRAKRALVAQAKETQINQFG